MFGLGSSAFGLDEARANPESDGEAGVLEASRGWAERLSLEDFAVELPFALPRDNELNMMSYVSVTFARNGRERS